MSRNVHIVGTGTIGEPLIGLFTSFKDALGVDEVSFSKRQALLTDRSKVNALMARGARLAAAPDAEEAFRDLGMEPTYSLEEALDRADVVIDCTPVGNKNKVQMYEKILDNTKGFIAQGSEFGFGKMYARGINDETLDPKSDRFIQVVSCNTHNLSCLIRSIGMANGVKPGMFESGRFVCIRRANDISQDGSFIPAHQVNVHGDDRFGTHHAHDAYELFKTKGMDLNLFSSAMKSNTQYMHTVWFHLKLTQETSREKVLKDIAENDLMAVTHKKSSNSVFSFGRDQGHFGRILNQTVIAQETLHVVGDNVYGWCFTPQDGNSLLSSVAAASFFFDPDTYQDRVQVLKPYFFNEV